VAEINNSENVGINTSQKIYDTFNDFIFSNDTKVFAKLVARTLLFKKTLNIPGDIVECGVFKGSGILTWLKLKKILCPNSMKKVIGFDFFDTKNLIDSLSGVDKGRMEELFISRNFKYNEDYKDNLEQLIQNNGFGGESFELIKGDISSSAEDFCRKRPGFKISLLYLDMDIEKPTFDALTAFWERMSIGGLVIFDEYAYHQWSESIGVDRFFKNKSIPIKILNFDAPTAYVQKV
jgi:hypothetical protein